MQVELWVLAGWGLSSVSSLVLLVRRWGWRGDCDVFEGEHRWVGRQTGTVLALVQLSLACPCVTLPRWRNEALIFQPGNVVLRYCSNPSM